MHMHVTYLYKTVTLVAMTEDNCMGILHIYRCNSTMVICQMSIVWICLM